MVEVSRSGAVRSMISWSNVQQNTARIDRTVRIPIDTPIRRNFSRSILHSAIARGDGFIARSPQIATAGPTSEIGCFAGLLGLQRVRGRCRRCVCHMTG